MDDEIKNNRCSKLKSSEWKLGCCFSSCCAAGRGESSHGGILSFSVVKLKTLAPVKERIPPRVDL